VGELAKAYYPEGIEVRTLNLAEALKETNDLLKKDNVTIFEAALNYNNLFIRVDILVKQGNRIRLIEVKAKSIGEEKHEEFYGKEKVNKATGESYRLILAGSRPYLYDVGFQTYVAKKAFPHYDIEPYLFLTDKTSFTPTEGLNQKFKLVKQGDRTKCLVSDLTEEDLSTKLLTLLNVKDEVNLIFERKDMDSYKDHLGSSFEEMIQIYEDHFVRDKKIVTELKSACKKCQFFTKADDVELKSGRDECWTQKLGWTEEDLKDQTVLEIWNSRKTDKFLKEGLFKIKDLDESDIITPKKVTETQERQWLQVEKVLNNDPTPWVDRITLKAHMDSWQFPLHMIDFETSMVPIPFHKGRRPYEMLVFQYSHHSISESGKITHQGQYLNDNTGVFPNFDFVRALKKELETDEGTIFCYSGHENTSLNSIYTQLMKSDEQDKEELLHFIETISVPTKTRSDKWGPGPRKMVDLLDILKKNFYHPLMKGSNSIKKVLPAILNTSTFLQDKYSKPIYSTKELPSLNFPPNWVWIKKEGDTVIDPYKLLPGVFEGVDKNDLSRDQLDSTDPDDELADGGAAMIAYARIQFSEVSEEEKRLICQALLKYCELDTFSMVLLYPVLERTFIPCLRIIIF
jgi:hypothetical protein